MSGGGGGVYGNTWVGYCPKTISPSLKLILLTINYGPGGGNHGDFNLFANIKGLRRNI